MADTPQDGRVATDLERVLPKVRTSQDATTKALERLLVARLRDSPADGEDLEAAIDRAMDEHEEVVAELAALKREHGRDR